MCLNLLEPNLPGEASNTVLRRPLGAAADIRDARHDGRRREMRRGASNFMENQGGPKEGGLNIGQHEGLIM